ncbi:protein EFR3 homolog cmp44E isoform X2 [Toxorhynchites rutilus septentrionalis]|uniref:protein EFR3 homolog cmp44E isoform X2 n=1 Tax=Toxorhynchites rutilus septentrionalis TaxID=329112 RepID=UPI00247A5880|nr:protein EFR3 homolog cmp44E isoform X2 [Toxorhynchites rutilus septentrionalis]
MSCCGCCSALRPRYKRLVDNIFPVNPEDGLVKSNMEKLTFYSLRSPEKLDRIGEYLYQRASKDIYRKRYKFVEIAMEAMDLLLMACHAQILNLFVESFLRMVQKLLEDTNPTLQIMATNSFVRFANIEEDTPSYHRRYDFFISKFSSMCYGNNDDLELRDSMRMAGIKGLQGVIRKTVSDDLVENIWEKQHMEKIVPSLLFNMQSTGGSKPVDHEAAPSTPPVLAEAVLRELVSRASFGHIRAVLKPLLTHLDLHKLWVPNLFAIDTFRIVMISIQPQYSYTVVETLMSHLDQNLTSSPKTRTSLAVVLSKIIAIAAGESVGPSALDIINNLLTHLKTSVSTQHESTPEETQYQEALINALGEFANHHPDYQKIEIMLFIMNTVPDPSKKSKGDQLLQNILLKSLLKVGTQYRTVSFEKAFPVSFLQPLLKMARASSVAIRVIVMQIFQQLLDRHQNQHLLNAISVGNYPTLTVEQASRSDILFTHKYGSNILQAIIDGMSQENNLDVLKSSYNTAGLMVVEMACGETVQEFLLFVLGVQQVALTEAELSPKHRCNLHSIAIALLILIGRCTAIGTIVEYAEKLIQARKEEATYLLPPLLDNDRSAPSTLNTNLPHLMIDKLAISECLQQAALEHTRVQTGTPYSLHQSDMSAHRHSWVDTSAARNSIVDANYNDVESVSSSPGVQKRSLASEYNFESMKRVLAEPTEASKRESREKQAAIGRTFRETAFDDLLRRTEPKHDVIQNKLNEIFNSLSAERQISCGSSQLAAIGASAATGTADGGKLNQQRPIYANNFPELFFY